MRTVERSRDKDAKLPLFSRLLRLIAYGIEGLSLKTRLVLITASTVIFAIAVITGAAYTTVSQGLYQELDKNLHSQPRGISIRAMNSPSPGRVKERTTHRNFWTRMAA